MTDNETLNEAQPETEVAANEDQVTESNENPADPDRADGGESEESSSNDHDQEFPQKAVNALNRKNKRINKLRAQIRELEAKLKESPQSPETKDVNPDDFESYGDYIDAKVKALVDQKTQQSQSDMHKQHLTSQQEQLKAERDLYIIEQANEVAKALPDLPVVWQQNAELLDSLPESVADIFYSVDNAPAAIYALAKEGKLESLLYANPAVAAIEIVNAEKRGMEMISKPPARVSQAPTPITKARGSGSVKKQLSPNDDVLKSLGFKQ